MANDEQEDTSKKFKWYAASGIWGVSGVTGRQPSG